MENLEPECSYKIALKKKSVLANEFSKPEGFIFSRCSQFRLLSYSLHYRCLMPKASVLIWIAFLKSFLSKTKKDNVTSHKDGFHILVINSFYWIKIIFNPRKGCGVEDQFDPSSNSFSKNIYVILFYIKQDFWWVALFVLQVFLNRPNFNGKWQNFDVNKLSAIMNVNLEYLNDN